VILLINAPLTRSGPRQRLPHCRHEKVCQRFHQSVYIPLYRRLRFRIVELQIEPCSIAIQIPKSGYSIMVKDPDSNRSRRNTLSRCVVKIASLGGILGTSQRSASRKYRDLARVIAAD
jgi:hypothetical protein